MGQDFSNHNGGCIKFGPDGKLYFGLGDGGSANDPNGRAQNTQQLLGKMLRYDVDIPAPFIPADNPFVGNGSVRDEIWHIGLRNPWRFTFDRATGDMWIADVGQNAWEEIDLIERGGNYGWPRFEGNNLFDDGTPLANGMPHSPPLLEYDHSLGRAVIGGYVLLSRHLLGFRIRLAGQAPRAAAFASSFSTWLWARSTRMATDCTAS